MKTSQIVMIIIIVCLGLGYYEVNRSHEAEKKAKQQAKRLFADLDKGDVSGIKVVRKHGKTLDMVKQHGRWLDDDKLLSSSRLNGLANQLATLSRERVILAHPKDKDLSTYGLDKPSYRLTLSTAKKGDDHLLLGNRTPEGNSFYARAGSDGPICTVSSSFSSTLGKKLDDLRQKSPLPVAPTDVRKLRLIRADGKTIELVATAKGSEKPPELQWTIQKPARLKADESKVSDLLWSWKSLSAGRFLNPTEKVDWSKPLLRIEAFTKGHKKPQVLEVGPAVAVKPNMHYVRRLDPDEAMVIDFSHHKKLLDPTVWSLQDRHLADFKVADAEQVTGKVGKIDISARRSGQNWTVEKPKPGVKGPSHRGGSITDLLWNLKDLRWDEPAKPGTDLGTIRAELTVTGKGKKLVHLRLGKATAGGGALLELGKGKVYTMKEDPFPRWQELAKRLAPSPKPTAASKSKASHKK